MTEKPLKISLDQIMDAYMKESGFAKIDEVVEVLNAYQQAIETIRNGLKSDNEVAQSEIKGLVDSLSEKVVLMKEDVRSYKQEIAGRVETKSAELKTFFNEEIEKIESVISNLPQPEKVNIEEILETAKKQIPEELKAEKIADKLNTLTAKIERKVIKDLDDEFKRLEKKIDDKPTGGSVGGVSNLRIQQAFKYILKTEQPVGDLDGVNLTYRVSQTIFAILSMSINGETIAQLPNYTIAGNTFTFTTALPAAYSGKDWEIKYI